MEIYHQIYFQKMTDTHVSISKLNYSQNIDEISKIIFKHIKNINENISIKVDIINKDDNYMNYIINLLEDDKIIYEKKYKKKHNSKRGLNSINNLWHNKNKVNPINDEKQEIEINNINNNHISENIKIDDFGKDDKNDNINNINEYKEEENKYFPKINEIDNSMKHKNIFDENKESEINISLKSIDEKNINDLEISILNKDSMNNNIFPNPQKINDNYIKKNIKSNICNLSYCKIDSLDIEPNDILLEYFKLNAVDIHPEEKRINLTICNLSSHNEPPLNIISMKNKINFDENLLNKI